MRSSLNAYAWSAAALIAAVLLRWLLDPIMGETLPLVTLFGAVCAAVWVGGVRPAVLVAILGYIACAYLFIEPRGALGLDRAVNVIGLLAYLFTCSLLIAIGKAMRVAQAKAIERRELLQVTLRSIGDAVITTDVAGRITYLNVVAESLTGWRQSDALGQPLESVFRIVNESSRRSVENPAVRALRDGTVVGLANHTLLIRKDGTERPIDDSAAPIKDELGRIAGCVLIFRDVTAQREADAERERMNAELAEGARQKDQFIAMMAHELRNPLAPISNAVQILRKADGDGEVVHRSLGILDRQVAQMSRLLDDLLDISRISRGRIELREERVALATLVDNAVEAVRPLAESMGQQIVVKQPSEPIYLDVDPARLAQVLGNLLNNACKFSEPGDRIEVETGREAKDAVIRVRDNGIGIAPENLERIFEMFTQLDTSEKRSRDGLGVGLALVKRLVEMHGGSVAVRSAGLGRGAEFTVRLRTGPQPD